MTSILSFFLSGWMRWAVLALAITIGLAVVRHHLIQEGRDEVLNEMSRQEVRVRNLRDGITQSMEVKHAKDITAVNDKWTKFVAGLRDRGSSAKPVPVAANVCGDAARDAGLSDAISAFIERNAEIRRREHEAVAGLLEKAERNTKA